jgi:hypothetical protein
MSLEGIVEPPAKALVEANKLRDIAARPARSERLVINIGGREEFMVVEKNLGLFILILL